MGILTTEVMDAPHYYGSRRGGEVGLCRGRKNWNI